MPNSAALAALRTAILDEKMARGDAQLVLSRYEVFVDKLIDFRSGNGPTPTLEEYAQWRRDIFLVRAIHQLEGVPLHPVNTRPLDRP